MTRRSWTPQLCVACGCTLEEWKWPRPTGVYIVCCDCGIPYVQTAHGLARVPWDALVPELATAMGEVMQSHWSERINVARAYLRAA